MFNHGSWLELDVGPIEMIGAPKMWQQQPPIFAIQVSNDILGEAIKGEISWSSFLGSFLFVLLALGAHTNYTVSQCLISYPL